MARTRPKAERRASLLDAAERLLVERGISRLTVEEVTTAAGVSKGTFYLYFSTKDDVIASLRERYATRVLQRQEAVVNRLAPADWAGRVETWLIAGVQDYLADPGLHDALFHHARRAGARPSIYADGSSGDPLSGPVAALSALLEEGARAGALAVADPPATAVLLFGAAHHAADYLHHANDEAMTDRVLMELRRWCRMVVGAGRAGAPGR